jgi:hypothetical protein
MSQTSKDVELSGNGWPAVPRSFTKSLADVDKNKQADLSVEEAKSPSTDIAKKTVAFAKEKLPEKTFNHSMRVWYYGKRQSPSLPKGTTITIYTSRSGTTVLDNSRPEWTRLDCVHPSC